MPRHLIAAISLVAIAHAIAGAPPALAQAQSSVTGIDKIHAQVRVGSKICMSSHAHYGEGTMPSRKGAEAAAVRSWQIFTADEYGSAWGRHGMSAGKTMSCAQSASAWTCKTEARPCRPAR